MFGNFVVIVVFNMFVFSICVYMVTHCNMGNNSKALNTYVIWSYYVAINSDVLNWLWKEKELSFTVWSSLNMKHIISVQFLYIYILLSNCTSDLFLQQRLSAVATFHQICYMSFPCDEHIHQSYRPVSFLSRNIAWAVLFDLFCIICAQRIWHAIK